MRKFILQAVPPLPPSDKEGSDDPRVVARRLLIANEGPKCAAWLVKEHKRQLRTKGAMRYTLWKRQELPMWFALAFAFLSDRAGWECIESTERGGLLRVFLIKWINRGHFKATVRSMRTPS